MKLFRFILSVIDSLRQRGRQCRYCKYFIETNSPHGICGSAHSDNLTRLKVNCTDWCKQYKERGKDAKH